MLGRGFCKTSAMAILGVVIALLVGSVCLEIVISPMCEEAVEVMLRSSIVDESRSGDYPVNDMGMTYGPVTRDAEEMPDLILTQNEEGEVGYVRSEDFGKSDITLEEVLAGVEPSEKIPMYTSDMTEIVGYLSLS